MKMYKLAELVLDFDFYPRGSVDTVHASRLMESMNIGRELPPIIIEKKTKRIVDGFHRHRAYRLLHGLNYKVLCVEKTYKNDGEFFLDCIRYNSTHGLPINMTDKLNCIIKASKLEIDQKVLSNALNLSIDKIGILKSEKVGVLKSVGEIALKNTIRHMNGKTLTPLQGDVNVKLSGMNQVFHVNQLLILIESGLIDFENHNLMESLKKLHGALENLLVSK